MRNKPWSNAELLTLGDLYREGKTYNEIAVKMNRTKQGVASALHKYRYVINVPYRYDACQYETKTPESTVEYNPKKPWWAFWRV